MKRIIAVIIMFSLMVGTYGLEEIKTRDDFEEIPIKTAPLVDLIPNSIEKKHGIIGSGTMTLIGISLTTFSTYSILESDFTEINSGEIQQKILFTSSAYIFTILSSWVLHYFIFLE